VIFGILAGAQIMGIGGILLALPLLAVGREIVEYVRERIAFGSWPSPVPDAVLASAGSATVRVPGGAADVSGGSADAAAAASRTPRRGRAFTHRIQDLVSRRRSRGGGTGGSGDGPDADPGSTEPSA
jgi:hypothetical protein